MNKDIIYDERELTVAARKLDEYIDYLVSSIEAYSRLLEKFGAGCVNDSVICSKIDDLIAEMFRYENDLFEQKGIIKRHIKAIMSEMDDVGKYKLGSTITMPIKQNPFSSQGLFKLMGDRINE